MGQKIEGKLVAEKFRNDITALVQERVEKGLRTPALAIILVGNDGGSQFYVRNAKKLSDTLNVNCEIYKFDENSTEDEVIKTIERLNENKEVDGIMLQLPLPANFNEKYVISKISYDKDVDGLTDVNIGRLFYGGECFTPCTPKGIIELIKSTGIAIAGKKAVVLGRSNIVGKPVAQLLLNENATVTICHSKTQHLKEICSSADILVIAIGQPLMVNDEYIKPGAIVIDVGTTMVEGRLVGDVIFEEAVKKAAFVTPVPGGVGAMTTTMLLLNTCEALKRNVY